MTDWHLSRRPLVMLGANWLMGAHADHQPGVFLPLLLHDELVQTPGNPGAEDAFHLWQFAVSGRTILACLRLNVLAFTLLAVCTIPTLLRHKKHLPLPRRGFLDFLLFGLVGLIGCLMSFLGVWSLHPELGAFNWNLIWCWPTHLLFALVLLFKAHSPLARNYARVAAIGTALAALAYFFVPQALPTPLFPLALLLAMRAWRWGWAPAAQETPSM